MLQVNFQNLFTDLNIQYENLMLVMKQKNDTFTGKIKVILDSEKAAKKLFSQIRFKDFQSFPPCAHFNLLVQKETTILQMKKEKRELKEAKNQAKLIQKRINQTETTNKAYLE